MTITPEQHVNQIATEHPLATRVFHRHGIDFCCGGGVSLETACRSQGVDSAMVLHELQMELGKETTDERNWGAAPADELIQHILNGYHEPLYEELPRLEALCTKVEGKHFDKMPTLRAVQKEFTMIKADLLQHMAKEEQILFPMIQSGHTSMTEGPISVMRSEHDEVGAALLRIRQLTNNYQVPEEACNSWRALWAGLESLEFELHKHIHLENNILFPAVMSER